MLLYLYHSLLPYSNVAFLYHFLGTKATQVTAGPTQQTGEAAKRKSTFDLTIVYYVLSGVAFVLLLCFLVCVLRYRRTYHVKR